MMTDDADLGSTSLRPTWLREMDQAALQRYAELSGDRNPIHLDREQAVLAGHPDVICHGMVAMTDIGGWLTHTMAGWRLVTVTCRFVAPMAVDTRLRVSGTCQASHQGVKTPHAALDFTAADAEGNIRVRGQALFQRPGENC
ncbi:MaoC family dehydratase [Halomonas sp. RA08-2]|uniref:MaoC family dehydratase n=1 Tax=Halomonas sp. RA08-2 TaxID=3440842 RepID=UPI003EF04A5C